MAPAPFLRPGSNTLKLSTKTSVVIDIPADISDDASRSELMVYLSTALAIIGSSLVSQDRILSRIRPAHEHARSHPNTIGCKRRLTRWETLNGRELRSHHRTSCIQQVARFLSPEDIHLDLWEMATSQEPAIRTKWSIVDWFTTYCEGEEGWTPRDQRSYVDELRVSFGDEVTAFCAVLSIMAFMVRGMPEMDQSIHTRYQGMADSMWSTVMSTNISLKPLRCPAAQRCGSLCHLAAVSQLCCFFLCFRRIPECLVRSQILY